MTTPNSHKAEAFRDLHREGCFVIPNPWDAGSARLLAELGFAALATSSGAAAGVLGRRDGEITRDEALAHARAIVQATDLPVAADLENGFGDAPEDAALTIRLAGGSRAGRRLDRGFRRRARPAHLRFRACGRAHRRRGRGRAQPAVPVHADGALRELPARQARPGRHDPPPAGLSRRPVPTCCSRRCCPTWRRCAPCARRWTSPSTSWSAARATASACRNCATPACAASAWPPRCTVRRWNGLRQAATEVRQQGSFGYLDRLP